MSDPPDPETESAPPSGPADAPTGSEASMPPPRASQAPSDRGDREGREGREGRERRRRLEGVIPELLKRAVELGVEKAQEAPDNLKQFVGDMKLPKEIGHYLLQQIDETKNGLFRVVAKEIRDFLEHTNFAGEIQRLLTTVQFEINTTIRFTPNDGAEPRNRGEGNDSETEDAEDARRPDEGSLPKPEVKTAIHVGRGSERSRRRRGADDD